jgi:hypothetical protein
VGASETRCRRDDLGMDVSLFEQELKASALT